jgi:hypothetical protein
LIVNAFIGAIVRSSFCASSMAGEADRGGGEGGGADNGQIEPISAHVLSKRSEIITGPKMGSRIPRRP